MPLNTFLTDSIAPTDQGEALLGDPSERHVDIGLGREWRPFALSRPGVSPRRRKDACRPAARITATEESGLVHSSVIVTGGNRQAMRRAIEANHDPSSWRQAVETERLRLRLLPGLLLS